MKEKQNSSLGEGLSFSGDDILKIPKDILDKHPPVRIYRNFCFSATDNGRIESIDQGKGLLIIELLNKPRGIHTLSLIGPIGPRQKCYKEIPINDRLMVKIPSDV